MIKRIGIIGFGEMGKRHGLEFREATKGMIEIAGVVEPDDDMYRRGCEWNELDSIPRFATVRELLEKAQPDGVIISSPNFTHLENLKELAGCRIPILLEKPLDVSLEKVADIVRFARTYGAPIVVDHVMRYAPVIRKARELIEAGKLGKTCSFDFVQRGCTGMFHNFRRTREGGGSHIIEKATHDLDVMLFLTGAEPLEVSMISAQQVVGGNRPNDLSCPDCPDKMTCRHAYLKTGRNGVVDVGSRDMLCVFAKEVDVPDNETCLIKLSGGIFGTYSHSYIGSIPGHSRIYEILGSEGALYITLARENGYIGEIKYYPFNDSGSSEVFNFEYFNKIHYYGGPYVARHFYNLMCGTEKQPFTTVEQAFAAEALGFAAMRSAETGSRFVRISEVVPLDL